MKSEVFLNYASALFSLAVEENKVDLYKKEAHEVKEILALHPELVECCSSYSLERKDVYQILGRVFGKLEGKSLLPFLKLLASKHLFARYPEIQSAFDSLCNAHLGIKEGIVYSISPLSKKEIQDIEEALSRKLKAEMSLKNRLDRNLLGGLKVAIDGKVYDGSLQAKLENLRSRLLGSGGNYENKRQ